MPHDAASLLRLVVLLAAATAAALYRPAGVGLGIGTAALPLAWAVLGWGGAALVPAIAGAAIALVPPVLAPRERRSPRSRTRRALDDAALHALAGGAAGVAWMVPLPP